MSVSPLLARFRQITVLGIWLAVSPWVVAEKTWDASDTRLANHYIQSLSQNPEYGKVLDLLWDHYATHDQTRLLLQYFEEAAQQENAFDAKLIHAHLLRKKGNPEAALLVYEAIQAQSPGNRFVMRALAEVHRQLGHPEVALEAYSRLVELLGSDADDWSEFQQIRADLFRQLKQREAAIALWLEILEARPGDLNLRKQIVAFLLEEGETRTAIASYAPLLESSDVETRILAMKEVGRLYEFLDDFDNAVRIYREALSTIHFKHYLHDEFLARIVRVHERFSRSDELAATWRTAAEQANPSEESLLQMVQFYEIAANPVEEEIWLRRLVERVPSNTQYQQRLAERLVDNDHYEEAEALLEVLAKKLRPTPLPIVLLQARVWLSTHGVEETEARLSAHLQKRRPSEEDLKQLLRFSQANYLDGMVERLLIDQYQNGWGEEGRTPELQLAAFHHERGRLQEVRELLLEYAEGARNDRERGERLLQISSAFRDLGMLGPAKEAVKKAIEAGLAGRDHYLVSAEILVEENAIEEALAEFETVWGLSETVEQRIEVDQRIFTVLRAHSDETKLEKPRKISEGEGMASVWRFFHQLREKIEDEPTPENRFRLAWWSVKTAEYEDAWKQLPLLHDPQNPTLAYEELLLDLGERTNSKQLVVRQLNLIAEIEPEREEEALIRQAQMMLEQKLEDRAIRMLRLLVDRPDASLKAVQALAKAYHDQERFTALNELWESTYAKANILERRQILKPYVESLVSLKQVPDALDLMSDMIEQETDLLLRRKLFEDQLTIAARHTLVDSWMLPRYEDSSSRNPLDRFFPEAVARIHLAKERIDEALVAMKRAYYMADDDTELLKELGQLASQSSDLKAAIYYQRQLIATEGGQANPEDWLELIDRLERDLRVTEANQTRRRLEGKFGQDADFLKELSRHYLDSGDHISARRILTKIVALRSWDAESLLELGLLFRETGEPDRAIAAFQQILAETRQSAPSPNSALEIVPFVPARTERTMPGTSGQLNLEDLAVAIDEYDFLPDDQLEKLAEWMRQSRPEFLRNPGDNHPLRLRAIEELAQLGAAADAIGPTEELWSSHHRQDHAQALALLESVVLPKTETPGTPWDLLYPTMVLQHHGIAQLETWVADNPARKAHLLLAIYLLLREPSFQFTDEDLNAALKLVRLPFRQTQIFVSDLRTGDRLREALQFGEAAVETQGITDYMFFVDLALICEQGGNETGRLHWLERAFGHLSLGTRLPYYAFFTTVSEMYRLQSTAEDQQRVLRSVREQIQQMPDSIEEVRTKAEMWLMLATDRPDEAMELLGEVARLTTQRRKQFTGERDRDKGVETWVELETLLKLAGQRIPRDQLASLANAISDPDLIQPAQEHSAAQFQQFRMIRLLWQLETANPPRRRQMIEEFLANVTNEDEPIELARSLEFRGLAPDALPIYRQLVRDKPTEMRVVSSYLDSCRQAKAYDEALHFLDQIYHQGVARPETMDDDFLHHAYANLFFLAGDVGALTERVEAGVGRGGSRSPYIRYLANSHEAAGDLEMAIRLTYSLADDRPLGTSDTLMLADLMAKAGDLSGAIDLVERIPVVSNSPTRMFIERRLARWYAEADPDRIDRIAQLITNPQRKWSTETLIAVTNTLAEAGNAEEADAILTLKAEATHQPEDRFPLLLQRAKLRLTLPALKLGPTDLQQLVAALPDDSALGEQLLDLVQETAAVAADAWQSATEALTRAEQGRVTAWATALLLPDPNLDPGIPLAEIPSWSLLFAAKAAHRSGRPELAWNLLQTLHRRFESHPLEQATFVFSVLDQLNQEPVLLEWHQRALRWNVSTAEIARLATFLAEIGRPQLAAQLFDQHYRQLRILTRNDQLFLSRYAQFLIERKQFRDAERVLMNLFLKSIGGDPNLLVDLYGAWGKLDQIEANLRKFFLPSPTIDAIRKASEAYPNHWPEGGLEETDLSPGARFKQAA